MDISKLDIVASSNEGAVLEVLHPKTLTKTGIEIILVGTDSDIYNKQRLKASNKRLEQLNKTGKLKRTAEEIEEETIEMLVSCTIGWSGIEEDGKPLEFTPKHVKHVYEKYPWIREQIDQFIGSRDNFLS